MIVTVERIIYLMKKNDINNFTLERTLDLSNNSIGTWKRGRVKPSFDAVIKIARYFNVSMDYLSGLTDEPAAPASYPLSPRAAAHTLLDRLSEHDFKEVTLIMEIRLGNINSDMKSKDA